MVHFHYYFHVHITLKVFVIASRTCCQTAICALKKMYVWWSLCTLNLHACQVRVTVVDSGLCLLCLCDVFRALINSLVCYSCLSLYDCLIKFSQSLSRSVSLSLPLFFSSSLSLPSPPPSLCLLFFPSPLSHSLILNA